MAENRICKKTGKKMIVMTSHSFIKGATYVWDDLSDVIELICSPADYDNIVESLTRPETKLDRYLRGEDDI